MKRNVISLNGTWLVDYISNEPYISEKEPSLGTPAELRDNKDAVTAISVPGYWEDMGELFRSTPLHTKLSWNPMYTLQRYPQTGYCPDMALPNPYGAFVYQREFALGEPCDSAECELYVGGVQNALSAWINGIYLGRHEGYSAAFCLKIPKNILKLGQNKITLAVSNNRLAGYKGRPVSGLSSRAANECTMRTDTGRRTGHSQTDHGHAGGGSGKSPQSQCQTALHHQTARTVQRLRKE